MAELHVLPLPFWYNHTMIPTEAQEQITFVEYLKLKQIPHFRVPNETFTRSWKQKAMNKALGVSAGVPDLFLIVDNQLVAIEMKRTKGSTTSPAQKQWLELLNNAGIPGRICFGAAEAIDYVKNLQKT